MKLFVLLLVCIFTTSVYSYGESDSNGTPSWRERESFALMNFVRQFPTQYRSLYMSHLSGNANVFGTGNYSSTFPLYYNATVTALAQSHSQDMATNNCFKHNNCDNTTIAERFTSYLSGCSTAMNSYSENIAAGTANGYDTNNLLLCDPADPNNIVCSEDYSKYDGHRRNFMNQKVSIVGIGYSYNSASAYKHYYTQDFSKGGCGTPTSPIYSGYHTIIKSGSLNYVVNYYDTVTPITSMTLTIGTTIFTLPISYGNANNAIYIYDAGAFNTGTPCGTKYFFEAKTSKGTTRYPTTGFLQLTKTDSCAGFVAATGTTTGTTTSPTTTSQTTTSQTTTSPTTTSQTTTSATTTSTTTTSATTTSATTTSPTTATSSTTSEVDGSDSLSNSNQIRSTLISLFMTLFVVTYLLI